MPHLELFRKERTIGLFKYSTPSFPFLSGGTDLRSMGRASECGTWHIEYDQGDEYRTDAEGSMGKADMLANNEAPLR